MKNKFKIIFSFVTILLSTICHGQSEGVPEEIQNILIGRWVPTERVCLRAELNGIGNLIRKKNNSLSGNYWLLKGADINNIEPVLVRKYQITSGKIIDSSQKIYEIRGVDEDVINNTKFEFIQVFKLLNNFTRTTIDYIRNDKVLTKDGIDVSTNKTNQFINCESPEMIAKKEDRDKSNQDKLLAKQQEDMMLAKQQDQNKHKQESSLQINCTSLSDVNDINECQKRKNPNSFVDLHLSPLMKQCESMSKTLKEKRGITIFNSQDYTLVSNNCHLGCSSSDKCAEILIDRIKGFYGHSGSNECLDTGKLPICALKTSHPSYVCGREYGKDIMLGGYGMINRMCNDNSKLIVKFQIKNNLSSPIKDVTFRCESIAASGTVIGTREVQVFEIWQAGEVRGATITIPHINQTASLKCIAKSWK